MMKPLVVAPALTRRRSSLARLATTDPSAEDFEALGLFLRPALSADADPDVVHAVERMAQDGVAPLPPVLNALVLEADALSARLVERHAPEALCVLLATLQSLSSKQPTAIDAAVAATAGVARSPSPFVQLHSRVAAAVRSVADQAPDDDWALAFKGDAASLHSTVISTLQATRHHERIARLLLTTSLPSALPPTSLTQLETMAVTGQCADTSEWTRPEARAALASMTDATRHELWLELSRAATARPSSAVLSLWAAVHAATTGTCVRPDTIDVVEKTTPPVLTTSSDFYAAQRLETQRVVHALERYTTAVRVEAKAANDEFRTLHSDDVEAAYDRAARGKGLKEKPPTWWKKYLPSLAKLEILRDFAQIIGLVFTNLYTVALKRAPETVSRLQRHLNDFQAYLRGLANLFAADYTAMLLRYTNPALGSLPDVLFAGLLLAIFVGCVGLFVLAYIVIWKINATDETPVPKEKHVDKRPWWRRPLRLTIPIVTAILTICQSVHLPVARLSMEILTGTDETSSIHKRYHDRRFWPVLYYGAYVLLIGYVCGLVVLLLVLIYQHVPRVRDPTATETAVSWRDRVTRLWRRAVSSKHLTIVDLDGTTVNFRNSVYAAILARDPTQLRCPYRSLYADFERRWRYYKVVQLVFKVVLTMLLIPIRDARIRAIATLVMTSFSFLASFSAPFIDDMDDRMEQSARATAVVTCVGGVVLAYCPDADTGWTQAVGVIVNLVNAANALVMVSLTFVGSDTSKTHVKALWKHLKFSDSRRYATDRPPHKVIPSWNIEYEVRHRVWHAFWKRTLLALGQTRAIEKLAHAKAEEERAADATTQHKQLQESEATALAERRHWLGQADETVAAVRFLVQSVLQGPDVWYGDQWGRLTVVPRPFACAFHSDDGDDPISLVEDHDVEALLMTNFGPGIVRRRRVRQQLRALSAWGKPIELPYERDESWRDEITFCCRYTRGVVRVSDAFCLTIRYGDGAGEVSDPETNESVHVHRETTVSGDDAFSLLGLSRSFDASPQFEAITQRPDVAAVLTEFMAQADTTTSIARQSLALDASDADLSHGFRFVVYNNPHIARRDLERYLAGEETNAALQRVGYTRRAALDLLYEQLRFVYADPRAAFWFVFWHDVYEQNGRDVEAVRANKLVLDPREPTSIAYDIMAREDLEQWLRRRKLWGERWVVGKRMRKALFHRELLDLLYQGMEKPAPDAAMQA